MDETTVTVTNLIKYFGEIAAVNRISFETRSGECFGLLGPNGAGKSTTIKILTTLLSLDGGNASICGYSVKKEPIRVRQLIGYVPQMLSVDGTLTGYENLMLYAKLYGLKRRQRRQRIDDVLKVIDLSDSAHRPVKTYSGGMVRRLEIGQAILNHPRVLFLDEPTVGLDPIARKAIWSYIDELRHQYRMTIFLTTHYMDEAETLCSRIAIMNRGKIAAIGTAEELRQEMGSTQAAMDDVFTFFAGKSASEEKGGIRDVRRSRRIARRLG